MTRAFLSKRLVNDVRPAARAFEIHDTHLTGFLLRVQPSGVSSYYVQLARGKRARVGRKDWFVTPARARDRARKILAEAQFAKVRARLSTKDQELPASILTWIDGELARHRRSLVAIGLRYTVIAEIIDNDGLTFSAAAKITGVTPPTARHTYDNGKRRGWTAK